MNISQRFTNCGGIRATSEVAVDSQKPERPSQTVLRGLKELDRVFLYGLDFAVSQSDAEEEGRRTLRARSKVNKCVS